MLVRQIHRNSLDSPTKPMSTSSPSETPSTGPDNSYLVTHFCPLLPRSFLQNASPSHGPLQPFNFILCSAYPHLACLGPVLIQVSRHASGNGGMQRQHLGETSRHDRANVDRQPTQHLLGVSLSVLPPQSSLSRMSNTRHQYHPSKPTVSQSG